MANPDTTPNTAPPPPLPVNELDNDKLNNDKLNNDKLDNDKLDNAVKNDAIDEMVEAKKSISDFNLDLYKQELKKIVEEDASPDSPSQQIKTALTQIILAKKQAYKGAIAAIQGNSLTDVGSVFGQKYEKSIGTIVHSRPTADVGYNEIQTPQITQTEDKVEGPVIGKGATRLLLLHAMQENTNSEIVESLLSKCEFDQKFQNECLEKLSDNAKPDISKSILSKIIDSAFKRNSVPPINEAKLNAFNQAIQPVEVKISSLSLSLDDKNKLNESIQNKKEKFSPKVSPTPSVTSLPRSEHSKEIRSVARSKVRANDAEPTKSDLSFCKTDMEQRALLNAKSNVLNLTEQKSANNATDVDKKLRELKILEAEIKYRQKLYEVRLGKIDPKSPNATHPKEYTYFSFFRNHDRSSASAKWEATKVMLIKITNLKDALTNQSGFRPEFVTTGPAAEDGELGKLNKKLKEFVSTLQAKPQMK